MNRKTKANKADSWQGTAYVVRVYSLLAVFSLGLFGSLHVISHPQIAVGYLELAGSVALLLNLLVLQFTGRLTLVKNIFLLIVLAFLGLMLVNGGTADTGAFWVFVFPVTAFFLAGKQAGVFWLAGLLGLIFAIWLLSANGVITIPYDGITLRQLAFSTLVVTVGIYAYQYTREQLVSESQKNRAELRAEKVRADVIVQHIAEGIVTSDAKGRVTFMNEMAQKMLGWEARELIGKHFTEMVPMLDEAGNKVSLDNRPLQHVLSGGESITTNTRYRRKDGTAIPVSITGTPLIVNGKLTGAIGTFRDISEEQDVVRTKSEFVTLASHQLRTPLSAVSWTTELLLNGDAGPLSPEQREHVAAIYKSNQRMAALVSEMLIVSGLDLHSLPVIPQSVELSQLAGALVKEQTTIHAGDHPKIHEVYDPALKPLKCDPEIVKLILRNLISNAIKYTPKKGKVTISITPQPAKKLFAGSKGSIECKVIDTGYGIPHGATSKIFSKFFRADNIAHRDTDGTGLGLYIVKALLDYVGGRISFRSEENKGTTFTVLLPVEGMELYRSQAESLVKSPIQEEHAGV